MKAPAANTGPSGAASRVGSAIVNVVMLAAITVFVGMTLLRILGGDLLTVRTGSMEPEMSPGDLIVARDVDPEDVAVGDVITFRVPQADNVLVTHRVTGITEDGFTTKGDANPTEDSFTTAPSDVLGREWFVVPAVGSAMVFLSSPLGTVIILAIPLSILAITHTRERRRAAAAGVVAPSPSDAAGLYAAALPGPPVTAGGDAMVIGSTPRPFVIHRSQLPADLAVGLHSEWFVVQPVSRPNAEHQPGTDSAARPAGTRQTRVPLYPPQSGAAS